MEPLCPTFVRWCVKGMVWESVTTAMTKRSPHSPVGGCYSRWKQKSILFNEQNTKQSEDGQNLLKKDISWISSGCTVGDGSGGGVYCQQIVCGQCKFIYSYHGGRIAPKSQILSPYVTLLYQPCFNHAPVMIEFAKIVLTI